MFESHVLSRISSRTMTFSHFRFADATRSPTLEDSCLGPASGGAARIIFSRLVFEEANCAVDDIDGFKHRTRPAPPFADTSRGLNKSV